MKRLPAWAISIATSLVVGALSWAAWALTSHDTRISVVETKVDGVKGDIAEIKDGQKEMNRKLDRLIEKQIPAPTHRLYGR